MWSASESAGKSSGMPSSVSNRPERVVRSKVATVPCMALTLVLSRRSTLALMVKRPVPRTIRVIRFFIRPLLMVTTKRDWQGMQNLPEGGFVLAPNHVSHLDPFLISHFMLDNNIAPQFLAKDTLVGAKGYGWILRTADQIPVYRSTEGAAESLRAAMQAVEAGKVVTIYPEGTITRDPAAWPMSGRTGAVRVALATGKPLVPLMQWGAQEILWPYAKRVRLFPRKTIHIRVGRPVDLSDFADRELTEEVLHAATDRLMDTLTAMMAEVRGELPSTPRIDVHTLGRPKSNYKRLEP
jgi:1-acyl-sn-glycerol-3-phosphate acyltransferase